MVQFGRKRPVLTLSRSFLPRPTLLGATTQARRQQGTRGDTNTMSKAAASAPLEAEEAEFETSRGVKVVHPCTRTRTHTFTNMPETRSLDRAWCLTRASCAVAAPRLPPKHVGLAGRGPCDMKRRVGVWAFEAFMCTCCRARGRLARHCDTTAKRQMPFHSHPSIAASNASALRLSDLRAFAGMGFRAHLFECRAFCHLYMRLK